MKIPKQLKVGGIIYKVTLDGNEKMSFCDRETNRININPRLSYEQMEIALFHEIIHATNLSLEDEVYVEGLAQALHQVFKDNDLLKK